MPDDDKPSVPPLSPFMDWVVRHSGWLIFGTILAVALLEGVGIYWAQRQRDGLEARPRSGVRE